LLTLKTEHEVSAGSSMLKRQIVLKWSNVVVPLRHVDLRGSSSSRGKGDA
jgi:hypothetical protein